MATPGSITVRVPLAIRRRPGRKTVVSPEGSGSTAVASRADPALVKALARAYRWQKLLDEGRYASISELAAAEKIERGYAGKLMRLTLLAPEVVQGIMDGRLPGDGGLPALLRPLPIDWAGQVRELRGKLQG